MSPYAALEESCQVIQGGRLKLTGNDFVATGYPAFGAGGFNGFLPSFEFDREAVILSSVGARCGKCFYADGKWASLANTQVILPDPARVDAKFLWYQLNDEARWPRSGSAQPFIKPSHVKAHRIVLPPIGEQRRIAAILDQADDLRRKRRAALGQLDRLFATIFDAASGETETIAVGLGEVCNFVAGNSLPEGVAFLGQESGHLLLKVSDIGLAVNDPVVLTSKAWVSTSPRSHSSLIAPVNAVVFPKRGGAIATNKKRRLGRSAILDPNLMAVASKDEETLNSAYLIGWFSKIDLASISNGSTVPQLNKSDLNALSIALPPIIAQRAFADRVLEIEKLKVTHLAQLATLDALFAGLQHRAFRGGL